MEKAKKEHEGTAGALVEESIPDVFVNDNLAESVLRDSIEKLEEEISERSDEIIPLLTKTKFENLEEF